MEFGESSSVSNDFINPPEGQDPPGPNTLFLSQLAPNSLEMWAVVPPAPHETASGMPAAHEFLPQSFVIVPAETTEVSPPIPTPTAEPEAKSNAKPAEAEPEETIPETVEAQALITVPAFETMIADEETGEDSSKTGRHFDRKSFGSQRSTARRRASRKGKGVDTADEGTTQPPAPGATPDDASTSGKRPNNRHKRIALAEQDRAAADKDDKLVFSTSTDEIPAQKNAMRDGLKEVAEKLGIATAEAPAAPAPKVKPMKQAQARRNQPAEAASAAPAAETKAPEAVKTAKPAYEPAAIPAILAGESGPADPSTLIYGGAVRSIPLSWEAVAAATASAPAVLHSVPRAPATTAEAVSTPQKEQPTQAVAETRADADTDVIPAQKTGRLLPAFDRVKRAFEAARRATYDVNAGVPLTDIDRSLEAYDERREKRVNRVRLALGVAAAGKVAWSVYAAYKGFSVGNSSAMAEQLADHLPPGGHGAATLPSPELTVASVSSPILEAPAPAAPATHVLASGENPWTVARDHLVALGNPAPTVDEIQAEDNQILAASGVPPEQAGSLPVGFELKFPGAASAAPETVPSTIHVLASGENPWTVARDHLVALGSPSPTADQINDYDKEILAASGVPLEQAGSLPEGFKLTLPVAVSSTPFHEPPVAAPASTPAEPIPPLTTVFEPLQPEHPQLAEDGMWDRYQHEYALGDGAFLSLAVAAGGLHATVERVRYDRLVKEAEAAASSKKKKRVLV